MSEERTLTPSEQAMVNCLYNLINGIYSGKVVASGMCSVDVDGVSSYVYYNEPEEPVLRPAMSKLIGLYEVRHRSFAPRINAPATNRSYGTH